MTALPGSGRQEDAPGVPPSAARGTGTAVRRRPRVRLVHPHGHQQTGGGWVATRREGVRIRYRLAGEDVAALYALLRQVARAHQPAVEPARTACLGSDGGKKPTARNCSPA